MEDPIWSTVQASRAWLDKANGSDNGALTFRILKVTEEAGEAAAAWIGAVGNNPRKGVTHTTEHVAAELADVAMAALVAIESLGIDARSELTACALRVGSRLGAPSMP